MKAVMLSVQPKWCELIASGEKTVEVRKTKPKLETPFKCYIYCTQGNDLLTSSDGIVNKPNTIVFDLLNGSKIHELNGKVIGEFVCDSIYLFHYDLSNGFYEPREFLWGSCLSLKQLKDYVGASLGYSWNITDLVIYDKPKELSEFWTVKCTNKKGSCGECETKPDCIKKVTSPPQSWCYVEEK